MRRRTAWSLLVLCVALVGWLSEREGIPAPAPTASWARLEVVPGRRAEVLAAHGLVGGSLDLALEAAELDEVDARRRLLAAPRELVAEALCPRALPRFWRAAWLLLDGVPPQVRVLRPSDAPHFGLGWSSYRPGDAQRLHEAWLGHPDAVIADLPLALDAWMRGEVSALPLRHVDGAVLDEHAAARVATYLGRMVGLAEIVAAAPSDFGCGTSSRGADRSAGRGE